MKISRWNDKMKGQEPIWVKNTVVIQSFLFELIASFMLALQKLNLEIRIWNFWPRPGTIVIITIIVIMTIIIMMTASSLTFSKISRVPSYTYSITFLNCMDGFLFIHWKYFYFCNIHTYIHMYGPCILCRLGIS